MRLFTIDEEYRVELNKEWIMLIPEFAALLKRDKGTKKERGVSDEGDYRGDKKLKARREFSFIYFDLDFTSPIREWEDYERREEAMKYAGLKEADLDALVMAAHKKYDELLLQSSRSLKTLRAMEKSLNALDDYFEGLNFTDKDKKGELVHSPNQYLTNLEKVGKAFTSVDGFKKRVQEELKGEASIRGQSTLGRKEGVARTEWKEAAVKQIPLKTTSFQDIAALLGDDDKDEDE